MKRTITKTDEGLFVRLGGSAPVKRRRCRGGHKWYVDDRRGTYCGTCGKAHPTETRSTSVKGS